MAALTFGLAAFIPTIQIDTDPENMLPADQADRVFHNQVKKEFALYDAIVVGVVNDHSTSGIFTSKTLRNIQTLTEKIITIDGVVAPDVMSLSTADNVTQNGPGSIRFEWLMKTAPKDDQAASDLFKSVKRLPLMLDTLVSQDGKAATIYVPIKNKDESYRISQNIQQEIDQLDTSANFHMTGLPVAEDTFGFEMFVQMGISAPMAAAMIFVLMLVFFKNLKLVTAPMIVAMATVISTMGLLIACGFTVHIMSSMIAIFLMPIAVVDSVHIMSEFADRFTPGRKAREVAKEVVGHLFTPMLFTSVTSTVGFLSLTLTPIPPVQIFGVFVGFGIMLAFLFTILFMPAYISRMTDAQLQALQSKLHNSESSGLIAKWLPGFGAFNVKWSKSIIIVFVGLFVFSVYGIQKIQINDNPVRWFKEDHRIRVADKVLNHHFAGTYDAFLTFSFKGKQELDNAYINEVKSFDSANSYAQIFEPLKSQSINYEATAAQLDDLMFDATEDQANQLQSMIELTEKYAAKSKIFTQPDILNYIDQLESHLVASGYIGKSNSVNQLVKTVNRELFGGTEENYTIPSTQNGVAQTLLQFQSSHRPQDLWHMVTPDYNKAVIWLQLTSGDNQHMTKVIDIVDQYISQHPLPDSLQMQWAGKTYINVVWQDAMVSGMAESLMSAFIVVFIMMVLLFRSVIFGFLAMLPLTLTITFIYGLIGWIGKDYDMPIAVLSALTLGLSVDFAIHFIERARSLFNETGSFSKTLVLMFEEPGRAISRNAIVIAVGFTPLLFAPLVPYITVGIFLASIMAASALVTLMMLPSAMNITKSFIFKPNTNR